jgi:hypothetical protein
MLNGSKCANSGLWDLGRKKVGRQGLARGTTIMLTIWACLWHTLTLGKRIKYEKLECAEWSVVHLFLSSFSILFFYRKNNVRRSTMDRCWTSPFKQGTWAHGCLALPVSLIPLSCILSWPSSVWLSCPSFTLLLTRPFCIPYNFKLFKCGALSLFPGREQPWGLPSVCITQAKGRQWEGPSMSGLSWAATISHWIGAVKLVVYITQLAFPS